MQILSKILVTLMGLGSGVLILRYSRQVTQFTGKFDWAEKYLGHGGTHTAIRLFGAVLTFVFILYPFGYWDRWLADKNTSPAGTETSAPAASDGGK